MITLEPEEIKLEDKLLRTTPLHLMVDGSGRCDIAWGCRESDHRWYIVVSRPWMGLPEDFILPATVTEERVARDLSIRMLLVLSRNPEITANNFLESATSHLQEITGINGVG